MSALRERREHGGVSSGDWNAGANGRAVPARARKRQPAAERLDSIAEAAQPAAVLGARSPTPSSATAISAQRSSPCSVTSTALALAYLAAFVSASAATKYSAAS